ncbi:DNA-directed RNA polymerase subunit beta [Cohnella faecalis]|uniref:DNA-directed RNA polymerase subunit beta n=2 Tax=Cohnella faecalis TaxID=2315694 RepID=A0A398CIL5_9BACL|nr:DNA-directed RNA polymerase subunit beta [Cohnella faecalis]
MTRSSEPSGQHSTGRVALRIIWTTVKIFIIPVLCVVAIIFGLAVGYSVLGKQPLSDVFDLNTWKHMYDLVFSREG